MAYRRGFLLIAAVGLLLIATVPPAYGAAEQETGKGPDAASAPPAELKTLGLTLDECVLRAYQNSLTLQSARQGLDSVATYMGQSKGRFDPQFFASSMGSEAITPSASVLDAGVGVTSYDQDFFTLSTGLRGAMLSGATYSLDLNLTRTFNPDSVYLIANPLIQNNVGIEIRQPLLQNGWTAYNRADILRAGINTDAEAFNLEAVSSDVLLSTIEAYWNYVFAMDDLKAKEKSMELAKDLLFINTRKKEEGVFSKMEVLEAQADVAAKEEELITARNNVRAAEDALMRIIFPYEESRNWDVRITPLTEPAEAQELGLDVDRLIEKALANRPDYRSLQMQVQARQVDLVQARNQLLPAFDIVGAYRYSALGSNFGNSFNDIWAGQYPYFSVGLEFSYYLGNRIASYTLKRAEIDYQRSMTDQRNLEVQIVHEIRDVMRELDLNRERIYATREALKLAQERYEGEKKRLEAGISISYQVREAERNQLAETVNEARAVLDYQIALARLERVQGLLLEHYGLSVPKPAPEDSVWGAHLDL